MTSPAPDKNASPASYADFTTEDRGGPVKTIVQFVAIPVLIVSIFVGLFFGIRLLFGGGPDTALDFVDLLRSDTVNRRRQAAAELGTRLAGGEIPPEYRDPRLVSALCDALDAERAEKEEEPLTALFLLRILARIRDPASVETVRAAAEDGNPSIRSYALLALGALKDVPSAPLLVKLADDPDAGTRQSALVALAALDQEEGQPPRLSPGTRAIALRHIADRHEDVRFQAAILLARAGEAGAALPVLRKMLDRSYLETFAFDDRISGVSRHVVHSNALVAAIEAVEGLPGAASDAEVLAALSKLSDSATEGDPNVRARAQEALRRLGAPRKD